MTSNGSKEAPFHVIAGNGHGFDALGVPDSIYEETMLRGLLAPSGEGQRSLSHYVRSVWDRKWTVLAVLLLGIAIATAYLMHATPYFVSSAIVEVEKFNPPSSELADVFAHFSEYELFYQTQLEALKSRDLANEFIRRMSEDRSQSPGGRSEGAEPPQLATGEPSNGFASTYDLEAAKAERINSVVGGVKAAPVPGTRLIRVQMGATDPMVAKQMLSVYLEAYIDLRRRTQLAVNERVRSWLKKQLDDAKKQLDDSRSALLDFTKKHGIVLRNTNPDQALTLFDAAGRSLLESKSDVMNLQMMAQARNGVMPEEAMDATSKRLKEQLSELRAKYQDMRSIYTPNFYKMVLLKGKITRLEETLADMEKDNLIAALEVARQKEVLSRDAYERTRQEAINTNNLGVQYEILRRDMEANAQVYLLIRRRAKKAELDQGIVGHNITVTSPPTLPLNPVHPRKSRILFLGSILGLFAGIGAALLRSYLDNSVRTTREIQRRLNLPVLGSLPKLRRRDRSADIDCRDTHPEFVAHKFPKSAFADSVRIIQNTALSFLPGDSAPVICVSSALPMEGKTLISVVMATVFASEGKRVLIIDGDMRRPRIHKIFENGNGVHGLSDAVDDGSRELTELIHGTEIPNLYYLTAGSANDNPVALLKSRRMQELIDSCRNMFDVVILDAPPVLGVADARVLYGYADGLILVTKQGHTPFDVLNEAKAALSRGGGRVLGIVLNMADDRADGYSYYCRNKYYYGRGSKYHQTTNQG